MLHHLDVRTLIFVLTLLLVVQSAVLLYLWRVQSHYPPARYWGTGALVCSAGFLLLGLRDLVPVWISIILASFLLLSGWLYFCMGIIHAAEASPPWHMGVAIIGAALASNAWFTLVTPDFPIRVLVFGAAILSFNFYTAKVCLSAEAGIRTPTLRIIAAALLVFVCSSIWRTVSVVDRRLDSLLSPEVSQVQFFLVCVLFFSVISVLLVLLAMQKLQDEISGLARHDALTGAFNRRALDEFASREWSRSLRHGYPLSFLMLDIDYFKRYNDRFGHRAGDDVLASVSLAAQRALRPEDVWCRYGGEEFVAMLPNTAKTQACHIAQRLRSDIRIAMLESQRYGPPVTVSIGVAEMEPADNQWEDVVDAADRALYQAKSEGRDRVILCERNNICANKIPK